MAATRYAYYQMLLGTDSPVVPDIGQSVPLVSIPSQPSQLGDGGTRLLQEEQSELDSLLDGPS